MWEEQQKMDVVRKAYHRAVQIPLDNVERLWQELEAFKTALRKITVCFYLKSCIAFLTEYNSWRIFLPPTCKPAPSFDNSKSTSAHFPNLC
jgi:hypothetical protein